VVRFGAGRTRSVCEIVRTSSGMVARHAGPDGRALRRRLHACMHAMHAQIPPGCACWHSVSSLAAAALLLGANTDVFAMSLVAQ
jgi:hypothetical protein